MRETFETLLEPQAIAFELSIASQQTEPDLGIALHAAQRWNESRQALLDLQQQWHTCAAQLDPAADLAQALDSYWQRRAPGTAQSRQATAEKHYQQHFAAACQLALAYGTLNSTQAAALHEQCTAQPPATLRVQRVQPVRADGSVLPANGVVQFDDPQDTAASVVIYAPSDFPAIRPFATLAQAEDYLWQHLAHSSDLPRADDDRINREATSLAHAAVQFSHGLREQLQSAIVGFAELPELTLPARYEPTHALSMFGTLPLDVPLITRWATLQQQQQALARALGEGFDRNGNPALLEQLHSAQSALHQAQDNSREALDTLLAINTVQDVFALRYPSNAYAALLQARRDGLRREGELQRLLGALSDDETALLEEALGENTPTTALLESLTLSTNAPEGEDTPTHELPGVLLISQAGRPVVLLYVPGSAGGLQRFDSREVLERDWLQLGAADQGLSVSYTPLTQDALTYGLESQLYDCEQSAKALLRIDDTEQRTYALADLLEVTRARLGISNNDARERACAQVREQQQSAQLAEQLPDWMQQLTAPQRQQLEQAGLTSIAAMRKAQLMLERDLPGRLAFAQRTVGAYLRDRLGLDSEVQVLLDLPESVSWVRDIVVGSGAPGTPGKDVLKPSDARVLLSLETLALQHIDDDMKQRLAFLKVEFKGVAAAQAQALQDTLDKAWLIEAVTQMDLGGAYERQIVMAFRGPAAQTDFEFEHRRECLVDPYRQMLTLLGLSASHQRHLDAPALEILSIAIDANSRAHWQANGHDIELLPVSLSSGGSDTEHGPSGLFAITFIHDRSSGQTVLYLPDAPDGQQVRAYASLEQARVALFRLTVDDRMRRYLAQNTLRGDPKAHEQRINRAHMSAFNGIIEIGQAWPATTSLAQLQLDMKMGRLIEAHRATSRSNEALWLETFALNSGMVFQYIKWAVGLVPFIGSAVAVYDAWTSANQALGAFQRGELAQGLAHLESVLLSVIDVLMDTAPGAHGLARGRTRQRQLRHQHRRPDLASAPDNRAISQRAQRFAGYAYSGPVNLCGVQAGSTGLYRQIYRLAEGEFIISQGQVYQVEFDQGLSTWRLKGTASRHYKQPIALDDAGQWDTHGALYGTLVNGGLAGGGGTLGRLADGLDPFWPQTIRERLPRWWTDPFLRRQQALQGTVEYSLGQLNSRIKVTDQVMRQGGVSDANVRQGMFNALGSDIEQARALFEHLEQLLPMVSGHKHRYFQDLRSRVACVVTDRTVHRCNLVRRNMLAVLDQLDQLALTAHSTPNTDLATLVNLLEQGKVARTTQLSELRKLRELIAQMNRWNERITAAEQRAKVRESVQSLSNAFTPGQLDSIEAGVLLQVIHRNDIAQDAFWVTLQMQMKDSLVRLDQTIATHMELPTMNIAAPKRTQILRQSSEFYRQFQRQLSAKSAGYPEFFEASYVDQLLDILDNLAERAQKQLDRSPQERAQHVPLQRSHKRIFETDDGQLLAGDEQPARDATPRHFSVTGSNGIKETYIQLEGGKWRRANSPEAPTVSIDFGQQLTEAQRRLDNLDSYRARVLGHYKRRNMLPADLEDMLLLEAGELRSRASRIESKAATHALIEQLRSRATGLVEESRRVRIEQSLSFPRPNEGMLDYLIEQRAVDIVRISEILELPRRPNLRNDFLMEYEIRDITGDTPRKLWYAHFHYESANATFERFTTAHLKTAEQRLLGLQWQQAQGNEAVPIWRGKLGLPMARKHFAALFA